MADLLGADVHDLKDEVVKSLKSIEEGIISLGNMNAHQEQIVELLRKELAELRSGTEQGIKERTQRELPTIDAGKCYWDVTNTKSILGEGGFGIVYEGLYRGEQVAVKTLKRCSDKDLEELSTEVCIHSKISALSGVIRLFGADLTNSHIDRRCIVLELADGSLYDSLYSRRPHIQWNLPIKLNIMLQVANTMVHIHQLKIIHRDIKPANILLIYNQHNGRVAAKLSDFGLAKAYKDSGFSSLSNNPKGTLLYMAPELQQSNFFFFSICMNLLFVSEEYSTASDVYAFCVSLNELMAETQPVVSATTGIPLFASSTEKDPILLELLGLVQNGLKLRRMRPHFDSIAESLNYLYSEAKKKMDVECAKGFTPAADSVSSSLTSQESKQLLFVDLTCKQVCSLLEFCELHHLIPNFQKTGLTGD